VGEVDAARLGRPLHAQGHVGLATREHPRGLLHEGNLRRGSATGSYPQVIEVRPRGVSKARVLDRLKAAAIVTSMTTIAAMGDDRTDEDTFIALPPEGIAIGVGYRSTIARYRVATPHGARAFLANIAA
jgi:trehalose-6-phosphatase